MDAAADRPSGVQHDSDKSNGADDEMSCGAGNELDWLKEWDHDN